MLATKCTSRQVKEAVVLADIMKGGPFDADGFKKKLLDARNELGSLTEAAIDAKYFAPHRDRLHRINEGSWVLGVVDLESCLTWPHFGGRKYAAMGPVNVTAETVRRRSDSTDRLWEMAKIADLLHENLPIVVIKMIQSASRFCIDDGANRAVAYYLAGKRSASAIIGVVPDNINHTWKWPGW
jgi:hypothetical protein